MDLKDAFIRHFEEGLAVVAEKKECAYHFRYVWDQESYETLFNLVWRFWEMAGFEVSEDEVPYESTSDKDMLFSVSNGQVILIILLRYRHGSLNISLSAKDPVSSVKISQGDLMFLQGLGISLQ